MLVIGSGFKFSNYKIKPNRLKSAEGFNCIGNYGVISYAVKKSASAVLTCYLIVISLIYPLYIRESGYMSIGNDKYTFFRIATLLMLAVMLILTMLNVILSKASRYATGAKNFNIRLALNPTQLSILIFLLTAVISWLLSPYRMTAWQGSDGWFMGLETYLLILLTYLFISHFWPYNDNIWLSFLAGAGIAFFIGILNRFSIYPFEFDLMAAHFISTLGNINWAAGYFAVIWPIGAGLYLYSEKKHLKFIAGFFTIIAMCLGIVLGSDSAFLSFIAVFYLLLMLCLGRWERYGGAFLELFMAWCLACQLMCFLRFILPDSFNYGAENISGFLTAGPFSIYLLLLALLPYILTQYYYRKTKSEKAIHFVSKRFYRFINSKLLKKLAFIIPLSLILLYIIITMINTYNPTAIPGLAGSTYFTFNNDWGSSRGATWNIGITAFSRMDPIQKLFGIGPDCFSDFVYTYPDLTGFMNERFNNSILKNAHNEALTMLINVGIAGLLAYTSIFITFFIRFIKKGKNNAILYIPAICLFSYVIHNIVSFGQILNLPFIFIIMAIGERGLSRL